MKLIPFLLGLLFLLPGTRVSAQLPSPSPLGTIEQEVGNTTIKVRYERPSARGREIFGGLVPYGEVWRTGAGYSTTIKVDSEVKMGGQPLAAGTYSLLTIPTPNDWTVILNQDTAMYGAYDYDPQKDVIRFRTPARKSTRHYESLTIDIDLIPDNARFYLSWGNTQISFPVETTTAAEVAAHLERLLTMPIDTNANYAWAGEHLLLSRNNLQLALQLADRQLLAKPTTGAYRVKMDVYEYLGYREKAIAAARAALQFRKEHPLDEANQKWSLNFWNTHLARLLEE
ncbi:DUF2911 domain-containing protein [Lewinella sp. 4G2]|uniref:DUF2911 domain-containing protein n=1 Tax=Lewinella sp. 4G2 TaxID=1803372 RepID=UPI0007B4ADAE|nr:DUF2911 domain-containing protein [Lewinella sp. 4G2]OAV44579.1 hypothetical protein A3850_008780 [Lewinella sp. 4G2]